MVHYRWNTVTDNILCEQDDAGELLATYTQEPGLYGELISQRRSGQSSYYHFDGQGSTRQLTDQNQDVTDEYTYSAFGETAASSGTTTNPFGFKGKHGYYRDSTTFDVYVRTRTIVPETGRWLSPDAKRFIVAGSRYEYAHNNPLFFFDPSGEVDFPYPDPDRSKGTASVATISVTASASNICSCTVAGKVTISVSITIIAPPPGISVPAGGEVHIEKCVLSFGGGPAVRDAEAYLMMFVCRNVQTMVTRVHQFESLTVVGAAPRVRVAVREQASQ